MKHSKGHGCGSMCFAALWFTGMTQEHILNSVLWVQQDSVCGGLIQNTKSGGALTSSSPR